MESISTLRVTKIGVVAASYVVLTLVFYSLSFQSIQFRIAEVFMLLCLYHKDYVAATSIGCFIANLLSPIGVIDVIVGTAATLLAGLCIYLLRTKLNLLTASFFPVLFNAVLVGLELKFVFGEPLLISMAFVAVGEVVCVSIAGVIIMKLLSRNKGFMNMLTSESGTTM